MNFIQKRLDQYQQSVKNRWKMAVSEYHRVLQNNELAQLKVTEEIKDSAQKKRTMGWLVDAQVGVIFPLHEGINRISADPEKGLSKLADDPLEGGYRLQIFGDILRVDEAKSQGVSKNYFTNDILKLGDRKWLVKLLPTRIPAQMEENV